MFACSVFIIVCLFCIFYFICIFLLLLPTWRIKLMMMMIITAAYLWHLLYVILQDSNTSRSITASTDHSKLENVPFSRCSMLPVSQYNACLTRISVTLWKSWPTSCLTLASSTQQTVNVNNSFLASHSIYNTCSETMAVLSLQQVWCGLTPHVK